MKNTKHFLMIVFITMILLITTTQNSYACSFEEKFEWVKQTFLENDAGVPHILERRGLQALDTHTQMILERIQSAETMREFIWLTHEWLRFFRRHHHQIMQNPDLVTTNVVQPVEQVPPVSHPNPGFWDGDIAQFKEYVATLEDGTNYEGIWDIDGNYKIGIVREGNSYIGFIIESVFEEWLPNMIKLRIDIDGDDVITTFYVRDFMPVVSGEPTMLGYNLMRMIKPWTIEIKRLEPAFQDNIFVENYFRYVESTDPFFEQLNENTMYFRLPLFRVDTTYLDRLIEENISKITSTENLIIDLRNNPGGSVAYPLLEYLYTNPIISSTSEINFYATPKNIQLVYNLSQGISLFSRIRDELKQFATKLYEKIYDKAGEFVRLSFDDMNRLEFKTEPGPITFDKVYQYPRNVGIITNRRTGSASEAYLFVARQSRKVKIFGETTTGAFDTGFFAGGGFVESPCGEIWLQYANGITSFVPDLLFNDIGIQPDFFIDNSVPDYRWVEHVTEIMSGWVTEPEPRRRRGRR